jgi:hypothetical protein
LEHDLEETKEKDEKGESPAESEDGPGNEITILQQLKSVLGIQRDTTVRITSKMMLKGAVKARTVRHCLNHLHFGSHSLSFCPVCVSLIYL